MVTFRDPLSALLPPLPVWTRLPVLRPPRFFIGVERLTPLVFFARVLFELSARLLGLTPDDIGGLAPFPVWCFFGVRFRRGRFEAFMARTTLVTIPPTASLMMPEPFCFFKFLIKLGTCRPILSK